MVALEIIPASKLLVQIPVLYVFVSLSTSDTSGRLISVLRAALCIVGC